MSTVGLADPEELVSAARRRPFGPSSTRALHVAFWLVGTGLAIHEAWLRRYDVYSDGLAYLDVGDAWWRHDWTSAINGYWSPLYSWLTSLAIHTVRPSAEWEAPLVHLINVFCFLFAMWGFVRFFRELVAFRRAASNAGDVGRLEMAPEWVLLVIGYVLFLWAALDLVGVGLVNPDMCVLGFFLHAAAQMLRMQRTRTAVSGVVLGFLLALGYIAKTPMFALSAVFLVLAFIGAVGQPKRPPVAWLALGMFLVVSTPYVAVLSKAKGRLTFGDSGKLAYSWFDGILPQPPIEWLGQPAGTGAPLHAPRRIFDRPAVYEFGSPIIGTYAYWQDPSFWLDGVRVGFYPRQEARAVAINFRQYTHEVLSIESSRSPVLDRSILFALVVLAAVGGRWKGLLRDWSRYSFVLVPALAMLGLYLMVHVEARYVAAGIVALYVTLFVGLSLPRGGEGRRAAACVGIVVLVSWLGQVGYTELAAHRSGGGSSAAADKFDDAGDRWQLRVASELRRLGLREGETVGFIGTLSRFYWARLAGVRIVAEIRQPLASELYWFAPEAQRYSPDVDLFWAADPSLKDGVMDAFARTGARAVVTDHVPAGVDGRGWLPLASTGFSVHFLDRGTATPAKGIVR